MAEIKHPPEPTVLLRWYAARARVLAWRRKPGAATAVDPYRVWLSEVMLQQTNVQTVAPYYADFIARWPTLTALAAASLDDVLTVWAGLGYYARARNLHKCARLVATEHGGRWPREEAALAELPGIGPYTAAAVAAIAFEARATPVDGNVERVMARLYNIDRPLPAVKSELRERARALTAKLPPGASPGDYAQAVMDLGAMVCTPRAPACGACPWSAACAGRAAGGQEGLPVRAAKAERPTRRGTAYWVTRPDGAVLLRRRPASGLLGGMMEVPTDEWRTGRRRPFAAGAPLALNWRRLPGAVRHTFTHFHLELVVLAARVDAAAGVTDEGSDEATDGAGIWVSPTEFGGQALPSVMRKVARHALAHGR